MNKNNLTIILCGIGVVAVIVYIADIIIKKQNQIIFGLSELQNKNQFHISRQNTPVATVKGFNGHLKERLVN